MRGAYQALREFAIGFFSFDTGSEFLAGFMSGLMVFAFTLLIALILYWLIATSRRAKGILLQAERSTWLEVLMEFQPTDGMPLPQMLDAFQKKTLAELEAAFGINSISEVKIRIGRVRPVRGAAIQ